LYLIQSGIIIDSEEINAFIFQSPQKIEKLTLILGHDILICLLRFRNLHYGDVAVVRSGRMGRTDVSCTIYVRGGVQNLKLASL
tara:strand:+ start:846 stop:1097 length:252 start_codon:yes stop_codon:yes gene_type:complete